MNTNVNRNRTCNYIRRVLDMARTSVICETPEVVRHLTDSLKQCPEVGHIGRMKNGFGSSAVGRGGYRDIKVNLRPSAVAHYVEVQVCVCFHLKTFFLPVDIEHTQCPRGFFILEKYKFCGHKASIQAATVTSEHVLC